MILTDAPSRAASSPRPGPTPISRPNARLSVGEVAARSGVSVAALRYYEDLGLIASSRAPSGHRRYERPVLRRLAVIAAGQRVGLSLAQIRTAFGDLPTDGAPTRADWSRLSAGWRAHIDARIRELEVLREDLDGCTGCGCLSLDRCPLYNPGDEAATEGPGPRLLRRARAAGAPGTSTFD